MTDIYALLDENGNVFYVGQTMYPEMRLKAHKVKYGENITMKILQKNVWGPLEANAQEAAWIRFYDHFYQLKNKVHARSASQKEALLYFSRIERRIRRIS